MDTVYGRHLLNIGGQFWFPACLPVTDVNLTCTCTEIYHQILPRETDANTYDGCIFEIFWLAVGMAVDYLACEGFLTIKVWYDGYGIVTERRKKLIFFLECNVSKYPVNGELCRRFSSRYLLFTLNGDNFNLDDFQEINNETMEMGRLPSKRTRWTLKVDKWTPRT